MNAQLTLFDQDSQINTMPPCSCKVIRFPETRRGASVSRLQSGKKMGRGSANSPKAELSDDGRRIANDILSERDKNT